MFRSIEDQGAMIIRPFIYLGLGEEGGRGGSGSNLGQVIRFELKEASPGWLPQVWDILEQVDYAQGIDPAFLVLPPFMTNCS